MTAPCVAPVSWLRLERRALGELGADAAREVDDHLARCPACRACLARIEGDARPLPPLPVPTPARRRWWAWPTLAWAGGALAAAAALLLIVLRPDPPARPAGPRIAIKGGSADLEAVVELVRERGGVVTVGARAAAPGDRLKVRVTCAGATPGAPLHADVVVFQAGEASFPLPPARVPCGNAAVVPGAFRLTSDAPATVCLALDPSRAPDRAALARRGPRGPDVGCVAVE